MSSRVLYLTVLLILASTPMMNLLGAMGGAVPDAGSRAITDNAQCLIVPNGETYTLLGTHTYTGFILIEGTLFIEPFDGSGDTGTLNLSAPRIVVGANGEINGTGAGEEGGAGGPAATPGAGNGGKGGEGDGGGSAGDGSSNGNAGGGGGGASSYGGDGQRGGYGGDANDHGAQGGQGGSAGTTYGDNTSLNIEIGSGGGGGGGSGGAGAPGSQGEPGGGAIWIETDELVINGSINAEGGLGGQGATSNSWYHGGGGGGGASGGGLLIKATNILLNGRISVKGGDGGDGGAGDGTGSDGHYGAGGGGGGGGRMKILYGEFVNNGEVDISGGQPGYGSNHDMPNGNLPGDEGSLLMNGRPVVQSLVSPTDGQAADNMPNFQWQAANDPDGDTVLGYRLVVDDDPGFSGPELDIVVTGTSHQPSSPLIGPQYYWKVAARDLYGFGTFTDHWMFLTDTVPPTSEVEELPEFSKSLQFNVNWTGQDDKSGVMDYTVHVSDDEGTFTVWLTNYNQTNATFTGQHGHTYGFYSIARDRGLNIEASKSAAEAAITVDVEAPTSKFDPLPEYTGTLTFDVTWSGSDDVSGIESFDVFVSKDRNMYTKFLERTTATSTMYQGMEGSQYMFYTRAWDKAGNYQSQPNPSTYVSTIVDTVAPVTTCNVGNPHTGGDPLYLTPKSKMTLAVEDATSGKNHTEYRIDDGDWELYTTTLYINEEGNHNITFRTQDKAGHLEEEQVLWIFIDGTPPSTTVEADDIYMDGDTAYVRPKLPISLSAIDNGSGLDVIKYCLDHGLYADFMSPFKLDKEGSHSLEYYSIDKLGQRETTVILDIYVDGTPPTTAIEAPEGGQNEDFYVEFIPSDKGSGVDTTYYRIGQSGASGNGWGPWTKGTDIDFVVEEDHSADGTYTIEYYSIDRVRNEELHNILEVIIDTVAEISVELDNGTISKKKIFELKGQAEPGSTVKVNGKEVFVKEDGAFSENLTLAKGANNILIEVEDAAGNEATIERTATFDPPVTDVENFWWLWLIIVICILLVVLVAVSRSRSNRKRKAEEEAARQKAAQQQAAQQQAAQQLAAQQQAQWSYQQQYGTGASAGQPPQSQYQEPPPPQTPYPSDQQYPQSPPQPPGAQPGPTGQDQGPEQGYGQAYDQGYGATTPATDPSYSQYDRAGQPQQADTTYQYQAQPAAQPMAPPIARASAVDIDREHATEMIDIVSLELQDSSESGIRMTKAKNNLRLAQTFYNKGNYQKALMYAEKAKAILDGTL